MWFFISAKDVSSNSIQEERQGFSRNKPVSRKQINELLNLDEIESCYIFDRLESTSLIEDNGQSRGDYKNTPQDVIKQLNAEEKVLSLENIMSTGSQLIPYIGGFLSGCIELHKKKEQNQKNKEIYDENRNGEEEEE